MGNMMYTALFTGKSGTVCSWDYQNGDKWVHQRALIDSDSRVIGEIDSFKTPVPPPGRTLGFVDPKSKRLVITGTMAQDTYEKLTSEE
jgi:hypothetical protein